MVPFPEFWWKLIVNQPLKEWYQPHLANSSWCRTWLVADVIVMTTCAQHTHPAMFVVLSSYKCNDSEEPQWRKFCFHSSETNASFLLHYERNSLLFCGTEYHYVQTMPVSEATVSNSTTLNNSYELISVFLQYLILFSKLLISIHFCTVKHNFTANYIPM